MKYKSVKGLLTKDESLIPVTFIHELEDVLHGFLDIVLFVIDAQVGALGEDESLVNLLRKSKKNTFNQRYWMHTGN